MSGFKVLLYHEIIKKEDYIVGQSSPIAVQQDYQDRLPHHLFSYLEDFEKQMAYLHDEGFHTLTLKEIHDFYYENKPLPDKAVLLTFDDLFVSVYHYAYPILKKYQLHGVGFAVYDWLFDEAKSPSRDQVVCMSKGQAQEMRDVFEYANHTARMHTKTFTESRQMVTAIQTVGQDAFVKDLELCEDFVDYKGAFAYPFGAYKEENIKWLKEAGYKLAFSCEEGRNHREISPLLLRREVVSLGMSIDAFKTLLQGGEIG